MKHVVETPTAPFLAMAGALEVHQILSWEDNLIWLAVCTATKTAAVVDGPEAGGVLDYCEAHGLRLTTILNTHTHADHIGVNVDLKRRGLLEGLTVVGCGDVASAIPGITTHVDEGSEVRIGEVVGRVMRTEGHIDGHVSYVFGDVLFCGDTLFAGGCGYLFDGPPEKMFDSLMRLAELPGGTRVCCAHEYTQDNLRFAWSVEPDNEALAERIRHVWAVRGEGGSVVPSTIAVETATNPFLRPGSPTLRARVADALPERTLASFADVFAATRALKDTKAYRASGDTELPLS